MTMTSGTRLGPYEIVAPIGSGGMGEVYKARDTRLDRSVAIKVLPAEFEANAQLKMRFAREAKTISQLSHPNICALYDVGENYLVMELLEGESLADRLLRGPLPLTDVLRYGAQIAEALGRAHAAGVVHRDLKPGNVMITRSGAKLLDFGLAKSGAQIVDIDGATHHQPLTAEGTILGTFQYMAPEQLEGIEADVRTDVFALGTLLYEMATGRRAFEGKTKTSLIAAIVSGEPKPITATQPLAPEPFEHVVRKCLEKDPDCRWQSAHDVASELRWIGERRDATPKSRSGISARVAWTAMALLLLIALAAVWMVSRRARPRVLHTEIIAPDGATFAFDNGPVALSPDGASIAFPAATAGDVPSLWLRSLESGIARPLKGTENVSFAFWSPNSKSIGFFADGKLKRMDLASGTAETLADAPTGRGGSWSSQDMILFTPSPAEGLYMISANGGAMQPATELNTGRGDTSHRFPAFLSDGRHFLAFVQGANEAGNVLLGSLDSKETKIIGTADGGVVVVPPDIVLFVRDRVLRGQRFNLRKLELEGEAVPLAEGIQVSTAVNSVNVSASSNGLVAYVSGTSATESTLTFLDQSGKVLRAVGRPADQLDPRIAPDGHAVLMSVTRSSGNSDIFAFDVRRDITTQLTFSPSNEFAPVWSPDSQSFAYTSFDKRPGDLFVKRVEGSGNGDVLFADKRRKVASQWTHDGKYIVYHALSPGTAWDIEAYSIAEHKVIPLVKTKWAEMLGAVSPDGRWLTYLSYEGGRSEIYVQTFPPDGRRWQVSGGGGAMPLWGSDGRQIFYLAPDGKLMSAGVRSNGSDFVADAPRALFSTRVRLVTGVTRAQYDVSRDGSFLMNVPSAEGSRQLPITIVENWSERMRSQ